MIFLDVVYNHFGPDGNYLAAYAPQFFRDDVAHALGRRRSTSAGPRCARFFTENALYWLMEYRFDGLRFDAVHAIAEPDWLDEMAAEVRATVEPDRHVHLVLEHDGNVADASAARLRRAMERRRPSCAARPADRRERRLLRATMPTGRPTRLARCLAEGFVYQGEPSRASRRRAARRRRARDLPPTAFVLFLQNHDQIGNRAVRRPAGRARRSRAALEAGDRAAAAVPADPAALHGRGDAAAARPSCSSPTITASSPRRCARAGGASSRSSRPSPTRRARARDSRSQCGKHLRKLGAGLGGRDGRRRRVAGLLPPPCWPCVARYSCRA